MKNQTRMFTLTNVILILTATAAALMAGLFYAWSCSINLGLGKLSDEAYLTAMQSTNRAIQNPLFFLAFFGVVILLPITVWQHYGQPWSPRFSLLLAAAIVYLTGTFGVTIFGNVPLNTALDVFDIKSATPETLAAQRAAFEQPWNTLNSIRAIASTVTVVLIVIACLYPEGATDKQFQ